MRKVSLAIAGTTTIAAIALAGLWNHPRPAATPSAGASMMDEAAALTASHTLVWRTGPALNLRLETGAVLTLTDHEQCGDLPCPPGIATRYRYAGWDGQAGGYRLQVTPSAAEQMILPFAAGDAALVDAGHAEPRRTPLALPATPAAVPPDPGLADWMNDIAAGRQQSEAPLLAASRGRASRGGARLTLALAGGRQLTLTDDLTCGQVACPPQVFRSFDYAGSSPDGHFHVVEEHWDEASAAMLVDGRSGAITALLGIPRFSPDGSRLVASVTDLEWSAPRRLEVWSLTASAPGVEFALAASNDDDTVYEVVGWDDADHIRLRRGSWASDRRDPATLVHDAAGWHIEASGVGD